MYPSIQNTDVTSRKMTFKKKFYFSCLVTRRKRFNNINNDVKDRRQKMHIIRHETKDVTRQKDIGQKKTRCNRQKQT